MERIKIRVDNGSQIMELCDDRLPAIPFYNMKTFACIGSVNGKGELILTVPESISTEQLKAIIVRPKGLNSGDLFRPVELIKASPLIN